MIYEVSVMEEMRNVVANHPVFPGSTISHATTNQCAALFWIARNKSGDWVPTPFGLDVFKDEMEPLLDLLDRTRKRAYEDGAESVGARKGTPDVPSGRSQSFWCHWCESGEDGPAVYHGDKGWLDEDERRSVDAPTLWAPFPRFPCCDEEVRSDG